LLAVAVLAAQERHRALVLTVRLLNLRPSFLLAVVAGTDTTLLPHLHPVRPAAQAVVAVCPIAEEPPHKWLAGQGIHHTETHHKAIMVEMVHLQTGKTALAVAVDQVGQVAITHQAMVVMAAQDHPRLSADRHFSTLAVAVAGVHLPLELEALVSEAMGQHLVTATPAQPTEEVVEAAAMGRQREVQAALA